MQEQKRFISASTAKILIGAAGASLMAIQLLLVMILVNHFLMDRLQQEHLAKYEVAFRLMNTGSGNSGKTVSPKVRLSDYARTTPLVVHFYTS
eukprot:g18230.t1